MRLARAALHEWEEPGISVGAGSGTVFFSGCPLRCCYCQNAPVADASIGEAISLERLVDIFLWLQDEKRSANINLVTPTHYLPWVVPAVRLARERGLRVPVVYNTSGYETVESIRLLQGVVDVFLTDFKYAPRELSDAAQAYSQAPDYHDEALAALQQMVDQTGSPSYVPYEGDANGAAGQAVLAKGVVVRHLLLPGRLDDSRMVVKELWERFGATVLYSFMSQYTPVAHFEVHPELNRATTKEEYEALLDFADDLGMEEYFWQDGMASLESFIPEWNLEGVRPSEAPEAR